MVVLQPTGLEVPDVPSMGTFAPVDRCAARAMIAPVWLDGAGLEILDREECLRLLADADTGRIALTVRALPAILPVRFVLDGERIVIRTGSESTLAGATRSAVVAFEADGRDHRGDHDDGPGAEWSVVATGLARHVTDERELAHAGVAGPPALG